MNKILIGFILSLSMLPAYAGLGFDFSKYPNFLSICNQPSKEYQSDILYLKDFFGTQDCELVTIRLSKLKHFTDFMVPEFGNYKPRSQYSWTQSLDFEFIHNWKLRYKNRYTGLKKGISREELFQHTELYSEFKNLITLQIGSEFPFKKPYCEILKDLPHLETLVIDDLNIKQLNDCDESVSLPEIIVMGSYLPLTTDRVAAQVIGVEYLVAMVPRELMRHPNLTYAGINDYSGHLEYLAANTNITHLSINGSKVEGLENLKEFYNLSWLTITCIENEFDVSFKNEKPIVCETPALKDLSFLTELELLKTINVPFNKLTNIDVIENLTHIRNVDVSNNLLTKEPNFEKIKKLNGFNYSNNPIPGLEQE